MPAKVSGSRRGASGAPAHRRRPYHRRRRHARKAKGKTAARLTNQLVRKLDKRYVNESHLEKKICPFVNSTKWASDYIIEIPAIFPITPIGQYAPATLTGPTSGEAFQITGNVFQMGIALTSDLIAYNGVCNPLSQYTDCAYPIGGLSWYNETVGGAGVNMNSGPALPIGTNPSRIMDGQYFNLKRTYLKCKISCSNSDSDVASYYVNPIHFRVLHITMKRDDSPLGKIKSVTKALFLDENGESKGLENAFDQTATQALTKQCLLEYNVDKRFYRVHQDLRFTLQNQYFDLGGDTSEAATGAETLNNGNSIPSVPAQKELTFTRNWGNKKTLMKSSVDANAAADGLYEPADENCKDMIVVLATRGNNTYSTRQLPSVNIGDAGTAGENFVRPGYACSFWGLTTGTDP